MTEKILGIGDPHLREYSDLGPDFENKIRRITEQKGIDAIITVGDILDKLPEDRTESDIEVGRKFFEALNTTEIPVLTVGGNHDYDAHTEIVEDFENVIDLDHNTATYDLNGTEYSFIGRGATKFDQGPEIPLDILNKYSEETEDYTENTWEELEEDLEHIQEDVWYSDLEEYFEVENDDRKEFRNSIDFFLEEYNQTADMFDLATGDKTVYVNHSPPFNTEVDINLSGNNNGSLVDKKIIRNYKPDLAVSGHLHDGGEFYLEQEDTTTTIANLGKRHLVELESSEGQAVTYRPLNRPDI